MPNRSPSEIFAPIGGQPNSCTLREYLAFATRVHAVAPCRLLVFGVGRDSAAWCEVNPGGTTRFLENNAEWIEKIRSAVPPGSIHPIDYQQPFEKWEATGFSAAAVPLPQTDASLFDSSWDAVFVDAPWGPTFGRHQSSHAATRAVAPGGLVALHDCEREREQAICRHILEERGLTLEEEIERLRIYRAPS